MPFVGCLPTTDVGRTSVDVNDDCDCFSQSAQEGALVPLIPLSAGTAGTPLYNGSRTRPLPCILYRIISFPSVIIDKCLPPFEYLPLDVAAVPLNDDVTLGERVISTADSDDGRLLSELTVPTVKCDDGAVDVLAAAAVAAAAPAPAPFIL